MWFHMARRETHHLIHRIFVVLYTLRGQKENNSLNLDIHGSQEHSTPSQPFSIENEKGFSGMLQAKITIQSTSLNTNSFSNNEASSFQYGRGRIRSGKSDTTFLPEISKSKDLNLDIKEQILLLYLFTTLKKLIILFWLSNLWF